MRSILIAVSGGSIAHTLRPLPIALRLRRLGARVVFGGRGPYLRFLIEQGFPVVPLPMLDYARVCQMMDSERFRLRGVSEYRSAVTDQRAYLEALQPDLVLQDGPDAALPLAAFEAGVGYLNLANASVLGFAGPQNVIPFRPWVRKIVKRSESLAYRANYLLIVQRNVRMNLPAGLYMAQRGISFKSIPQPALIPDLPELFGARTDIADQIFIGPLLYEPEVPLPPWWSKLDGSRPIIYVGVGSSGGAAGLRTIIDALAESEYQVVLSTADAFDAGDLPKNFFAARLVPRDAVLQRASAIVYHGGNATTYQAIKYGVPMVAIPAHFDHEMNARAVAARGLGVSILPHELTGEALRNAVDYAVNSRKMAFNLKRFQMIFTRHRAPEQGADLVIEFANRAKQRRTPGKPDAEWYPSSPVALEEVACDLCGETRSHAEPKIEEPILAAKQVYSAVRCQSCGLVYCSPRPSQASLWLLEPLERHWNDASKDPKMGMDPGEDLRAIRRLAKVDLQSRVLVAGCGGGYLARYLLDRVGCETLCVEEHPLLVRRARALGLWVRKGAIEDLPDEDRGFDLILFPRTLERAQSPKKVLASARGRLAPDGCLIVKTANGAKPHAAIDVPRALYAFTADTLETLLRKTGFAKIRHLDGRQGNPIWCAATPEAE